MHNAELTHLQGDLEEQTKKIREQMERVRSAERALADERHALTILSHCRDRLNARILAVRLGL